MKTVQLTLYSFDELSDEAKENALYEWNKNTTHNWDGEVRAVIKEFEMEFDVKVKDWSYSPNDHDFRLDLGSIEDDVLNLKGNRARAWFWNNHGDVLLTPRKTWWYRDEETGKWTQGLVCGSGEPNPVRKSKVFFERVYDGTCPFTGVCFDCDALDPLAYFCFGVRWDEGLKKRVPIRPTKAEDDRNTVESVLRDCVDSLFAAAQKDWEYQCGMEAFKEACDANGYTFESDGTMRNL